MVSFGKTPLFIKMEIIIAQGAYLCISVVPV